MHCHLFMVHTCTCDFWCAAPWKKTYLLTYVLTKSTVPEYEKFHSGAGVVLLLRCDYTECCHLSLTMLLAKSWNQDYEHGRWFRLSIVYVFWLVVRTDMKKFIIIINIIIIMIDGCMIFECVCAWQRSAVSVTAPASIAALTVVMDQSAVVTTSTHSPPTRSLVEVISNNRTALDWLIKV